MSGRQKKYSVTRLEVKGCKVSEEAAKMTSLVAQLGVQTVKFKYAIDHKIPIASITTIDEALDILEE